MDFEAAKEFAGALGVMKRYPPLQDEDARRFVQGLFATHCVDDTQAMKLVNELTSRYDEWPGPASFIATYNELFNPNPEYKPFDAPGPRPERACARCLDIGMVLTDGPIGTERDNFGRALGKYIPCDCDNGRAMSPQLLAIANARLRRGQQELKPFVVRDIPLPLPPLPEPAVKIWCKKCYGHLVESPGELCHRCRPKVCSVCGIPWQGPFPQDTYPACTSHDTEFLLNHKWVDAPAPEPPKAA